MLEQDSHELQLVVGGCSVEPAWLFCCPKTWAAVPAAVELTMVCMLHQQTLVPCPASTSRMDVLLLVQSTQAS